MKDVKVFETNSQMEADMAANALEENGVEFRMTGSSQVTYTGVIPIEIFVPEDLEREAKEILNGFGYFKI